jgi:hypothetical protein
VAEGKTQRIAEDAHGPRAEFDDIEIGRDLGSLEWTVSTADIDKQCRIDEDYDPAFSLASGDGGRIAPPQIQYRPPRWLLSRNYNVRGVFYRWDFENLAPIKPDVPIKVTGHIVDKWIARGREYVSFDAVGTDPDGREVFRTRRTHALDVITRDAPRAGRGLDSGIKSEKL